MVFIPFKPKKPSVSKSTRFKSTLGSVASGTFSKCAEYKAERLRLSSFLLLKLGNLFIFFV